MPPGVHLHRPLLRAAASGAAPYLLLLMFSARRAMPAPDAVALLWTLAGALYTQGFEYAYHRWAMHAGIPRLERAKRTHLEHHRIFTGEQFRSRSPGDLRYVVSEWYVFPLLFAVHYALFALLFPTRYAPAFFLGVTVHFLLYETCHWFTHVEDNGFDRAVARIPVLRALRARQIRHHLLHHTVPALNFNFTPPYAGDRLAGTLRTAPGHPARAHAAPVGASVTSPSGDAPP